MRAKHAARIWLILGLFALPALFTLAQNQWAVWQASRWTGQPAPALGALPVLDAAPLLLEDLRGQRVVLNFWATWCAPCRVEMPLLQAAHQRGDVFVIGVNADESPTEVRAYARELGLTFPLVIDRSPQPIVRAFGVRGYPTTLLIDRDGNIAAVHLGALDAATLARWLSG